MFAKALLIKDLLVLADAVRPLLAVGSALLPEVEDVVLDAITAVRHLSQEAAQRFVADARKLYADTMVAYAGNADAIKAFVAGLQKLVRDARGG